MFYEIELRFLCDFLKKCRVSFTFFSLDDSVDKVLDDTFKAIFLTPDQLSLNFASLIGEIKPNTIYKFSNQFHMYYILFILPQTPNETIMMIGPFLSSSPDSRQVLEIGESYSVSPDKQKLLKDYYSNMQVLTETDRVFTLIETFAERIWGGVGSYNIIDTSSDLAVSQQILSKQSGESNQDILINMKLMEQRYAYENEIMLAVSNGSDHKVANIMSVISTFNFDKRVSDSVKNLKYYCVVMNTLLRKAAEQGGVHPLYIDDLSSKFALRIEQLNTVDSIQEFMTEMLKSYCRLVRKHSTKKYSSLVQKTIALIDYDISSNLTLSSLASIQNISPGYLSTIFKKETGKTVTEYIIDKRISNAMRLLSTTKLQVQTVALHCGVMDVQYFSKVFKKKTGKTPKEFRESVNNK